MRFIVRKRNTIVQFGFTGERSFVKLVFIGQGDSFLSRFALAHPVVQICEEIEGRKIGEETKKIIIDLSR